MSGGEAKYPEKKYPDKRRTNSFSSTSGTHLPTRETPELSQSHHGKFSPFTNPTDPIDATVRQDPKYSSITSESDTPDTSESDTYMQGLSIGPQLNTDHFVDFISDRGRMDLQYIETIIGSYIPGFKINNLTEDGFDYFKTLYLQNIINDESRRQLIIDFANEFGQKTKDDTQNDTQDDMYNSSNHLFLRF
tara:strand:- start:12 stop:584 length:573 start_codon:yes stop_codon:yes gene_type:complete